jgi:DNA-directed RNA polymerase subunit RPC12/RpoP
MTARSFQCPSCGAPLNSKGNASIINCPHCNSSVIVPEELRQVPDKGEWITVLYDSFTTDDNNWLVGSQQSEYFDPLNRKIVDGHYRWEMETDRVNSISPSWLTGYQVSDFHLTVNGKQIVGSKSGSGWGLIFRIQDNQNYYSFRMTESQSFAVSVQKEGQWTNLVDWTKTGAIKPNGVNQLEVLARGTHFIFTINGQVVSELDDDHFSQGLAGLAIEGYILGEKIVFDFIDVTLQEPRLVVR